MAFAPATDAPAPPRSPSPRLALMLLVAINLFNYIDRQVLAAVEPEIRRELFADQSESDAKFRTGLLATAFLVSYMLIAPVFGFLADRAWRWGLVGLGVIIWSLASGASGIDWGVSPGMAFVLLLLTRCFVGIGEAAYGPVAPAMIADLYPVSKRGKVLAWFYVAIPVGGALGYAWGAAFLQLNLGWRWAFFSVVPPGLALGIWCLFMKDPPRGAATDSIVEGYAEVPRQAEGGVAAPTHKPGPRDYLTLLKIPSYLLNTLGMTMMTFAIGGLAFWMPDYLERRGVEGAGPLDARTLFGVITAVAGLASTIAGGMLGDALRTKVKGSYFFVSAVAMMIGFPMTLGFLYAPFPLAWVFIFLAVFCLFFNTGPTNTILANVTQPSMRASGFALNILIIHLLGDAISPPLIGWISGLYSMNTGFIVVSLAMLMGGLFWLAGMRHLERDTVMA
jgi:MFS family permease